MKTNITYWLSLLMALGTALLNFLQNTGTN